MAERITVIVNGAAGRGRGARMLPAVREAFAAVGATDVRMTTGPGTERAIAASAIAHGCTTLVAVGGDGTWSNVANAILASGTDCRLAMLAAGTGNDFAKTVGAPATDPALTARLAVDGGDRRVDVGRVGPSYFINAAGFGFDAAVIDEASRVRWLGGDLLYFYTALKQLLSYGGIGMEAPGPHMSSHAKTAGGAPAPGARLLMLVVANGSRFGGAFHIAPGASLDDGLLDVVSIGDVAPWHRIALFASATRGTHVRRPEVSVERGSTFTFRFATAPAVDRDGEFEQLHDPVVEVACLPRALRVVVGASTS